MNVRVIIEAALSRDLFFLLVDSTLTYEVSIMLVNVLNCVIRMAKYDMTWPNKKSHMSFSWSYIDFSGK